MKITNLDGFIQLEADKGKILTTLVPSSLRVALIYTSIENKDNYIEVDEQPEIELPYEPDLEEPEEILDGLTLAEAYHILLNENRVLQEKNKEQDELINITMMATDEMFMMLEPLLDVDSYKKSKGGVSPMIDMYVAMVQRGIKTIEQVPARYRKEVERILKQLEE